MIHRTIQERHFTRLRLAGRLTCQDADPVRALIADIAGSPTRRCLIDLTGVDFIDSAGIGMLLVVNGEAEAVGRHLALLVGPGQPRRMLALTRLNMIIPVYYDVDAYVFGCVPEEALADPAICLPGEDPLAVAARTLMAAAR